MALNGGIQLSLPLAQSIQTGLRGGNALALNTEIYINMTFWDGLYLQKIPSNIAVYKYEF